LPYALVQNSLLTTNNHKHKRNKEIGTSNGLTKHNEKKNDQKEEKKAQMKCSIAMLMDKRSTLRPKPKDYSGFGIL
jgi:hypothetical protein